MFKIFLCVSLPVLAIAWIIYGIYHWKMVQEEKKQPKQSSKRLQETRTEVSDWAKQMANFKKPKYKRPDEQNKDEQNKDG